MTREIKFRFWDKEHPERKMYYGIIGEELGDLLSDSERFEPMQFTGLKDKNGKEIYEGDVLVEQKKLGEANNGTRTKEVKWVNSRTRNGWNIASSPNFEVIGNIYENPELIK